MMRLLGTSLLLLAAASSIGLAADRPALVAAVATAAPVIDGDLSDAAWAAARPVADFSLVGASRPADKRVSARGLFDKERLYMAIECAEPNMSQLRAKARPRDGGAWEDDCIEIFLRPGSDEAQYYQLVISALGSVDDFGHTGTGAKPEAWDPSWEAKAKTTADGWQVELSIPFAELGTQAPIRGDVWGLKLGREDYASTAKTGDKTARLYTWPAGTHYGGATEYGLLVFGDRNVVPNAEFATNGARTFLNWIPATGDEGCFERVEIEGEPALLLKAPSDRYASMAQTLNLRPDGSYHLAIEGKGEVEWYLEVRQYLPGGGGSPPYMIRFRPSQTFVPYELDFPAGPMGRVDLRIGGLKQEGQVWVRRLRVEQIQRNLLPDYMAWPKTEPDPIHGLTAFMEREGIKPYERLHELGLDDCERLVFRDTVTGTEIWKTTNDSVEEGHDYALWPPYSANGAHLWFNSRRWIPTGQQSMHMVMEADGSGIRVLVPWYDLSGWWHPRDGDVYFYIFQLSDRYELTSVNVRTGERKILATLPPKMGVQLAEPGPEMDWLLVVNADGLTGLAVKMDGSEKHELQFPLALGETHFSRAHKGVFISFYHPSKYANASGEVLLRLTDDGQLDPNFMVKDKTNTEYRNFGRGGHAQSSPDETMFARASGSVDYPDGSQRQVILPEALGSGDYISWRTTPEWFLLETFNQTIKCWADGSNNQQICFPNSANSTYYSLPWSAGSPDGTKFAYRSTMTGNVEFYQAVVSRPLPPVGLKVQVAGGKATLTWQPPKLHKEIAGYLVYRSEESGRGYTQLTPEPVAASAFADTTLAAGKSYCYVVTALDYSGLESAYSDEVCSNPRWPGPVRLFREAEFAALKQPALERREAVGASNLHYVSVSDYLAEKLEQPGTATFALSVPRAGTYRLLGRARVVAGKTSAQARLTMDGKEMAPWTIKAAKWEWLLATPQVKLGAGAHKLEWLPESGAFELDSICLSDDAKFVPTGDLADQVAPPQVQGLAVKEATFFDVLLSWTADQSPDFSYYNLYASRQAGFTPSQATRIASPYKATLLDWGLKPDTRYYYRVTAVDRAGNEGPPSAEIPTKTQPLPIGQVTLEAETGQVSGQAVVQDDADASSGKAVWVPELGTTGTYPSMVPGKETGGLRLDFEVPVAGKYMVWGRLKSIWREANMEALVDGKPLGPGGTWPVTFGYYHEKAYMIWGPRAATSYIYCWCPARTNSCPEPRPFTMDLTAGPHQLELRGIGEGLSVDQIVITNDYSWIPPGPPNYY